MVRGPDADRQRRLGLVEVKVFWADQNAVIAQGQGHRDFGVERGLRRRNLAVGPLDLAAISSMRPFDDPNSGAPVEAPALHVIHDPSFVSPLR